MSVPSPTSEPAPAPPRPRRARGRGDELRDELLDAAEALLREQGGQAGLSIRAITKRAGVSPMALYLHFEDREQLLWELHDRGYRRFHERLLRAAAAAPDPGEAILAVGREYMRYAEEEPELYAVLFGPDRLESDQPEGDYEDPGMSTFDDVIALVQNAMDAGYAEPGDARTTAVGLWSNMHGFVMLRNCKQKIDWPDAETFLAGAGRGWLGLRTP